MTGPSYRAAGVNLDAAAQTRDLFKPHVRSTFGPQVLGDVGLFAGLFQLQGYKDPVLAASTDSVGTKLLLGQQVGRLDSLGHDIVN
ncbi:MAG: phosphoribosylformylglycinamidine cyclo-ligase, partial [Chloroflexi bacterium]|nr:phosphoribosylformylglycinamidine cyclo-ligase [Chloroflexota bacterium]